jgi:hypothetical protein
VIKFRAARGNTAIAGLVLSRKDCDRLLARQPINVRLRGDLGIDVDVEILLVGGEVMDGMPAQLAEYVDLPRRRP